MSVFSAPSLAISEVLVNLPVLNMVMLSGAQYVNFNNGFPLYVGVHRNEMAMSGKESFVSNTDPHSRLFNVDVMGSTKIPNIWRGADFDRKDGTVGVGWRIGLARVPVKSMDANNVIQRNAIGEAKPYKLNDDAYMMFPVYHHEGKWKGSTKLQKMVETLFKIEFDGERMSGDPFIIDMGVCTWLGAEHGSADIAGALFCVVCFLCNDNVLQRVCFILTGFSASLNSAFLWERNSINNIFQQLLHLICVWQRFPMYFWCRQAQSCCKMRTFLFVHVSRCKQCCHRFL